MKNVKTESKRKFAKINQYTAIFEPDLDVGGYTVTIPGLPGCISEGDTYEEALENITEAAELYLETLEEENKKLLNQNKNKGFISVLVEVKI